MNNIEFYNYTKKTLKEIAAIRGLSESELNKYYILTDDKCKALSEFKETQRVFAQMAMHAANATIISNIVDFENNIDFLKEVTCDFDADYFIKKFKISKDIDIDNKVVNIIVNELRKGLNWNSSKSKEKNKDSIARRYAKALIDTAKYISKFRSREDILNDLLEHYKDHNIKTVVDYFRTNIKNGYDIALTCDFLKEFDVAFDDIAKPDVHILDVMSSKNNYIYNKNRDKDKYRCLDDIRKIVKDINNKVKNENLTVYKLDRMIWLICSNRFFLHDIKNTKQMYLKELS